MEQQRIEVSDLDELIEKLQEIEQQEDALRKKLLQISLKALQYRIAVTTDELETALKDFRDRSNKLPEDGTTKALSCEIGNIVSHCKLVHSMIGNKLNDINR